MITDVLDLRGVFEVVTHHDFYRKDTFAAFVGKLFGDANLLVATKSILGSTDLKMQFAAKS